MEEVLRGIKGVNESLNPEQLGKDEVTILENMILDKDNEAFIPSKRGGFSTFITAGAVFNGSISATTLTVTSVISGVILVNQIISGTGITTGTKITAMTTGTGGVGDYEVSLSQSVAPTTITALLSPLPSPIVSLHDVVTSNNDNYILASTGTTLKKNYNTEGGWTDVITGLTTGLKTKIVPFNEKFVLTNGTDKPFIVKSSPTASAGSDLTVQTLAQAALEITPPVVTGITATLDSGGNLTASALYRWLLIYKTEIGEVSNVSRYFTYINSADDLYTTSAINKKLSFSNLPVSSDSRVTSRELYRTKGDGTVFYYVTALDNTVTTYTDNTADADLTTALLPKYITVPNYGKSIIKNNGRLFFGYVSIPRNNLIQQPAFQIPDGANFKAIPISGAGLAAGDYKYKYSFIDVYGNESYPSEEVTGTIVPDSDYYVMEVSGKCFARIGAGTYDTTIAMVRIYRTEADGSTFYKLVDIPHLDYAYEDSTPDATLITQEQFSSSSAANTKSDVYKSAVVFSEIEQPGSIKTTSIIQILAEDGDEITGLVDDQDGILVFKKNSICKLYTYGAPDNWRVLKLINYIGCTEPNSIIKVEGNTYFAYNNQIRVFPSMELISENFKATWASVTTINDVVFHVKQNYLIYSVIIGGADYHLVYDLKLKTWYKWFVSNTYDGSNNILLEKRYGSNAGKLVKTQNYTYAYLQYYDTSVTVDTDNVTPGSPEISTKLRTKTLSLDTFLLMRLRKILLNYKKKDNINISITISEQDDGSTIVIWDSTNATNTDDYKVLRQDLALKGRKFYMEISNADTIDSIKLDYNVLERGN